MVDEESVITEPTVEEIETIIQRITKIQKISVCLTVLQTELVG